MYEFLANEAVRWSAMALLIFGITLAVKIPYKKFITDKIKNEKKRKLANKAIVIFTLVLGIALEFGWCYIRNYEFTLVEFGYGLKQAVTAIAIYSALELKTNGAIDNPFDNEECEEIVEDATAIVNQINANKKSKKKDNKEKTAHERLVDLVGQINEN